MYTIILISLVVCSCSEDPTINWDTEDEYILVTCKLSTYQTSDEDPRYSQFVIVQKVIPMISYAFDKSSDQTFGITGAEVSITVNDSVINFEDQENGKYLWEGSKPFMEYGSHCSLNVVLEDGGMICSELYSPNISFESESDTIWFKPDSIIKWAGTIPEKVLGENYYHDIKYSIPENNYLSSPNAYYGYNDTFTYRLWRKFSITDSTIFIYTATDSLHLFGSNFTEKEITIRYYLEHSYEKNYDYIFDDEGENWPIENIEDISNVDGSFGVFTTGNLVIKKTYILCQQD